MTSTEVRITPAIEAFVDDARRAADTAFRVFRETGTVSANGTVNFVERVPGEELAVALNEPGPWAEDRSAKPILATFDGEVLSGDGPAGFVTGYAKVFSGAPRDHVDRARAHPVAGRVGADPPHAAHQVRGLAAPDALAGHPTAHRPQPVAGRFHTRPPRRRPDLVAIFEANGGVNVIGRAGLLELAKFVVLLEEGAQYQALGELVGGTVDFDATNLVAQWGRSGLLDEARRRGLV